MKNKRKSFLVFVMALALCFGMLPSSALAEAEPSAGGSDTEVLQTEPGVTSDPDVETLPEPSPSESVAPAPAPEEPEVSQQEESSASPSQEPSPSESADPAPAPEEPEVSQQEEPSASPSQEPSPPDVPAETPQTEAQITGDTGDIETLQSAAIQLSVNGIKLGSAGNTADIPYEVATGEQTYAGATFSVSSEGSIEDGRIWFRIRVPKGTFVAIAVNELYTLSDGGPNSPTETNDDPDYDYAWINWIAPITSGASRSFSITTKPFDNGKTAAGDTCVLQVQGFDGSEFVANGQDRTNNFVAKADQFSWNPVSISPQNARHDATTGDVNIPDLTYKLSTTPKLNSSTYGLMYAKSIHFENTFDVPMSAGDPQQPLVLIEEADLRKADGSQMTADTDYVVNDSVVIDNKTYLTRFTIIGDVANPNLPDADFTDAQATFAFKIVGAQYNKTVMLVEANPTQGNYRDMQILSDVAAALNTVTPYLPVNSGEELSDAPVAINNAAQYVMNFRYYNVQETGTETQEKSTFAKMIEKIGQTDTSQTSPEHLGAFPGNLVQYVIGAGFKNLQKDALTSLVFEDAIASAGAKGLGYTLSEIQPVQIQPGTYSDVGTSAALTVRISYTDASPDRIINFTNAELTEAKPAIPLSATEQAMVKSVRFEFSNVAAGFAVNSAPRIIFEVQDQNDVSRQGDRFSNTASMVYTYTNADDGIVDFTSEPKTSTVAFTYKVIADSDDGRFSFNKTGQNLKTPGVYPSLNDVMLFTATVKNSSAAATVDLGRLVDVSCGYLSAYNAAKVQNGGGGTVADIDPQYVTGETANVKLWLLDDQGGEVEADQDWIAGIDYNNADRKLTVTFSEEAKLLPEYTLKLTYTLYVSVNPAAGGNYYDIYNEFTLFDTLKQEVGKGRFSWTHHTWRKRNKAVSNITPGIGATANPIAGDILVFTLTVRNDTGKSLTDLSINDTFTAGKLEPYNTLTGLNATHALYETLVKDGGTGLAMNMAVVEDDMPVGIVPEDMAVAVSGNGFTVSLPGSELAAGETLKIVYTMRVTNEAIGGDILRNSFALISDGVTIGDGYCEITVDGYVSKKGYAHVVKSVVGVSPEDGEKPDTRNLVNGDKITYTVDVGNYHTRAQKSLNIQSIADSLPANLVVDMDSIALYRVTVNEDGTRTRDAMTLSTEQAAADYSASISELTATGSTLKIVLTAPYELKSELLTTTGTPVEKDIAKNRLEFVYTCTVDTDNEIFPSLGAARTVNRDNNAKAFFVEDASDIHLSSGKGPDADESDLDDIAATQSYVSSVARVTIYNDKNIQAEIRKTVLTGATVEMSSGSLKREYLVEINNHSLAELSLAKIVDILPLYESLDASVTPTITIIPAGEAVGQTHTLNYAVSDYLNGTATVKRLTFTGYQNSGDKALTFAKAEKDENDASKIIPVKIQIHYTVVVDAATAIERFRDAGINSYNYINTVAMYPADEAVSIEIINGVGARKTNDYLEGSDWDGDAATTTCYYNTAAVALRINSTAPHIKMTPYTVLRGSGAITETYNVYGTNSQIKPSDVVAWRLDFGNSNVSSQAAINTIAAGSKLAVTLPKGLTYLGFSWDAAGYPVIPDFLANETNPVGNPQVITETDRTVLIWTVVKDLPRSAARNFMIRTATQDHVYTSYSPSVYFVPLQDDSQYFYNNVLRASTEWSSYNYNEAWLDMNAWLGAAATNTHLVYTGAKADVFGDLGVNSELALRVGAQTVTSNSANRLLAMTDRDQTIYYTMTVNVDKAMNGFHDVVLINRLPLENGKKIFENENRGSQANAKLLGNGNVALKVCQINNPNALAADFDDSMWVAEYLVGEEHRTFTDDDWENAPNARWVQDTDDYSKVTAIRIRVDEDYVVQKGYRVVVTFEAKLDDYNIGQLAAYDSFGFSGYVTDVLLQAEPLPVGVAAPVPFDRAYVTKELYDDRTAPKQTGFTMDLVGKDSFGVEQLRQPITVETDIHENGVWTGTTPVFNLDESYGLSRKLTYSVEERTPADFETPGYDVSYKHNPDGTTTWNIVVRNTPITHTVSYRANAGTGSQTDANSPYYTKSKVTVLGQGSVARSDYTFKEWNTEADGSGTSYQKDEAFVILQDVTLYAQWEPIVVPPDTTTPPTPPITPPNTKPPVTPSTTRPTAPPGASTEPSVSPSEPTPLLPALPATFAPPSAPDETGVGDAPVDAAQAPVQEIEDPSGPAAQLIPPEDVPLAGPSAPAWALLNLILTIVGLAAALILIIALVKRKRNRDEEEDVKREERDDKFIDRRKGLLWRILAIVTSVVSLVLFILTEDMTLPIVWTDRWTLWMIVLAVAELAFILIMLYARRRRDDDKEEAALQG